MPPTVDPVLMDARLVPNRSLSGRGLAIVLIVAALGTSWGAVMFLSMGALPVVAWFAIDALILYIAFRVCLRDQRQATRIRVTPSALDLHHVDGHGREKHASLPTAFVRVELDEPVTPTSWVRLCLSDTSYVVGRFLTPKERKEFVTALRAAIQQARTVPAG